MSTVINYAPPKTLSRFINFHKVDELFQCWVTGPFGSGKTTANFFKLIRLSALEKPDPDGVIRTRAVIVRNTYPMLKDTTLKSWNYWFRDGQAGHWNATDKIFTLIMKGMEIEVMFRPLDTAEDIARVLSLEINFAIVDEFVEIPRAIIEALSGRCGRYNRPDGNKPTIFGIWGASNPSTEDNWWHDYLFRASEDEARNMPTSDIAEYFMQPSGFAPDVENLENLPNNYYTNLAKGKTKAWIKQFIEGEWGFSIAGQPVVPAFSRTRNIVKGLKFDPVRPLIIGVDPGLGGSACVFMQQDVYGAVKCIGEIRQRGVTTAALVQEHIKPYLTRYFPNARVVIAMDPAANNRSGSDGTTHRQYLAQDFDIFWESNNRLPLRLNAIEYFATRHVGDNECLQIDPDKCPGLVRALSGGWRYEMHAKKDMLKKDEPEDNEWTHIGDAFGYGCRYFHKAAEREIRYKQQSAVGGFKPPQRFGSIYNVR